MHRLQTITNHLTVTRQETSNRSTNSCTNIAPARGEKIALIGSGLIGRNWAVLFARAGYNVCLYDISSQQLETAMHDLQQFRVPLLAKYGMLFGCEPRNVVERISTSSDLQTALKDAIFIQEGVPENVALKQKVFKTVSDALYAMYGEQCKTIISSSSSTIVPSKLIAKMTHLQSNLIVSHPVNPPMAIPVVELCPSPQTASSVVQRTQTIMSSIGLKPCTMKKEAEGFIVNRLQYALLQAAYQCIADGICDAHDIDKAVKDGLGLRWSFMGPFETIHLNAPQGVNDYCARYVDACIHPVLAKMFADKDGVDVFQHWTPEVWNKIHDEMERKVCKKSEIKQRCAWRDNRLLNLAVHKREQDAKDAAGKL